MRRFNIYSILVILNPETEDDDYVEDGSTFNLDKVKSFVDTDALSPGAQELMRSMEQYQQVISIPQTSSQDILSLHRMILLTRIGAYLPISIRKYAAELIHIICL